MTLLTSVLVAGGQDDLVPCPGVADGPGVAAELRHHRHLQYSTVVQSSTVQYSTVLHLLPHHPCHLHHLARDLGRACHQDIVIVLVIIYDIV